MALKTDIRGMVHEYPDYFIVGREKIREYSKAVQSDDAANFDEKPAAELGHPAILAPLTFTAVYALLVQQDFFRNVDVGIETMNIVRSISGSSTTSRSTRATSCGPGLEIHSVDERFGADIVVTRNVCTNDQRRARPRGVHHADGPAGRALGEDQRLVARGVARPREWQK